MPDVFTKAKRSQVMSRIRGRGNKDTELAFIKLLRFHRIVGWRRHQRIFGNPDFVFRGARVAVFVDGCFWHGCQKHCNTPANNREFWAKKLSGNKARDRRVNLILRKMGWQVIRIWEHELTNDSESCVSRLKAALELAHDARRVDYPRNDAITLPRR